MYRLLLLLLLLPFLFVACGDEASSEQAEGSDSITEPEIVIINDAETSEDMSDDFSDGEKNYDTDNPTSAAAPSSPPEGQQGMAEAASKEAVKLVFSEQPLRLSIKVLDASTADDGRQKIKVQYRWYDRWSKRPYEMTGQLLVQSDGRDADFKVLKKNAELEAYTMIEGKTATQKHIDQL